MAHTVRFRLDVAAVAELEALRARVTSRGISAPSDVPAVTAARAAKLSATARAALEAELATLGTVTGRPDELVLAAVVDAELLAVHAAVHDALAGRVQGPVAAYLPGAWLPHCVLATERPAAAFAALHPVTPIRARVTGVDIVPP